MPRFFNTTGPCNPEQHYMLPPERRLPDVRKFIDRHQYFVIHAPRQVGKTTCSRSLAETLRQEGRVVCLLSSCEKGQAAEEDVARANQAVIDSLQVAARKAGFHGDSLPPQLDELPPVGPESRLGLVLEFWSQRCSLPIVLFLDEIDALLGNSLISVLR